MGMICVSDAALFNKIARLVKEPSEDVLSYGVELSQKAEFKPIVKTTKSYTDSSGNVVNIL
jgi:hypothetical protein